VALAGALVVAGVLTGAAAAGAATADPSPSSAATRGPSASASQERPEAPEQHRKAERKADQRERKAERKADQRERKAERRAQRQQRKAERLPGPAADRPPAPAVTGPAFVCDPARGHGQNVSAFARSLPKGPGRGRLVSQAARSDCGKPTPGD
jgi:ATPase subunit of ABC transporter with duplicated ATPase domains